MNEQLAQEVLNLIKSTQNFVVDQAPEVFQQMLASWFIEYAAGAAFCFLAALIVAVWFVLLLRSYTPELAVIPAVLAMVFIAFTVCNLISLFEVQYYPKATLVQHFTNPSKCGK